MKKVLPLNKVFSSSVIFLLIFFCRFMSAQENQKSRAIIIMDIEADPDGTQSLIRLLLYSNVIDIKGIIAITSVHQKNEVHPESVQRIICAYGKVQENLMKHEADFPYADSLLLQVRLGLSEYRMKGVGEGKVSQDSERIIKVIEEKEDRPLWMCVRGGPNTLAQAFY
jgi:hypothetical protein